MKDSLKYFQHDWLDLQIGNSWRVQSYSSMSVLAAVIIVSLTRTFKIPLRFRVLGGRSRTFELFNYYFRVGDGYRNRKG